MDKPVPDDPAQEVSDLRRRVADLERWFKLQDSQIRLLERERQKLAALVHHTDIAYLVLDRDLRVTWTNRAFKEHWSRLGVGGDAVGRSCSDVLCQQSDRCMSCPCGFSFRSRDVVHLESLRKIGGEERYFYISAMPIQDPSGEIDEVIVMLQDFTDLEALRKSQESLQAAKDAAEAANRAKSEFVANVSHEIRTPMNGVLGMTELLMAGTLTPSQQECARIAHESSVALLAIINDILDFSKMEASRFELEHLDFTIAELLEGLIRLLRPQAEKKGLALDVRLDPAVPRQVNGDPFRLRQVLLNLGSNAIKFTARGTVSIAVDLEREPDPALPTESDHDASTTSSSCILRFTVRDSGIGVSRDKVPYLFEPFSQADASTTRRFGGTGLGLAISKKLVELMDGAIGVESEPGAGSTFWFTANLRPATAGAIAGPRSPERIHSLDGARVPEGPSSRETSETEIGTPRILLVEDNAVNRRVAETMLRSFGCEVECVVNGREAVEAFLHADPYDLILMDCQMPEMDGFSATRDIRAREAQARHVPIVALTANAMAGDRQRCLEAGMDDYLSKPIRRAELREMVARWVAAERPSGEHPSRRAAGR